MGAKVYLKCSISLAVIGSDPIIWYYQKNLVCNANMAAAYEITTFSDGDIKYDEVAEVLYHFIA